MAIFQSYVKLAEGNVKHPKAWLVWNLFILEAAYLGALPGRDSNGINTFVFENPTCQGPKNATIRSRAKLFYMVWTSMDQNRLSACTNQSKSVV